MKKLIKLLVVSLMLMTGVMFVLPEMEAQAASNNYYTYQQFLNKSEKKLAAKYPKKSWTAYQLSQKATEYTVMYYGKNGHNDKADAYRHCVWNALMKKHIGKTYAEKFATAHEYGKSGIEVKMDMYNNKIGRSVSVSGKSDAKIAKEVYNNYVKKGKCKYIKNGVLVKTNK